MLMSFKQSLKKVPYIFRSLPSQNHKWQYSNRKEAQKRGRDLRAENRETKKIRRTFEELSCDVVEENSNENNVTHPWWVIESQEMLTREKRKRLEENRRNKVQKMWESTVEPVSASVDWKQDAWKKLFDVKNGDWDLECSTDAEPMAITLESSDYVYASGAGLDDIRIHLGEDHDQREDYVGVVKFSGLKTQPNAAKTNYKVDLTKMPVDSHIVDDDDKKPPAKGKSSYQSAKHTALHSSELGLNSKPFERGDDGCRGDEPVECQKCSSIRKCLELGLKLITRRGCCRQRNPTCQCNTAVLIQRGKDPREKQSKTDL